MHTTDVGTILPKAKKNKKINLRLMNFFVFRIIKNKKKISVWGGTGMTTRNKKKLHIFRRNTSD